MPEPTVAPKSVRLIAKKPSYRLVVSTAKSKLVELDDHTHKRVECEPGRTLEFQKHLVECRPEEYEALKKNRDSSYMVDWMSVEDWKALRKTDRKQAQSWRRELSEAWKLHMGNQWDADNAEDLLERLGMGIVA